MNVPTIQRGPLQDEVDRAQKMIERAKHSTAANQDQVDGKIKHLQKVNSQKCNTIDVKV